ncbi:MAG: efflux RND transporter periplasmic adaptor subunit [Deltaproteobacteria bacterium]|nr:MAG: efflux RND transporter periplasmic adaptor subunit [Deltaproteobacteria bacterium]
MISLVPLLLALMGCGPSEPAGHGHSHGPGGDHAPHGHEEEGESIAITRWTDGYELFVELDAPVVGQRFKYHAHVTRMADNHAATSGTFALRFEEDGFAVESHTDTEVARAGIFAKDAPSPTKPGDYRLVMTYTDGEDRVQWDGGTVTVGAAEPVAHEGDDEGEITFLKETQWQIPFAVTAAAEIPLAPTVRASAVVSTAPGQSTVVAAPVEGLLAWSDGLPVVGRRVQRGERLAALVPAGAAESWSRLQADLATSRVDLDLAEKELARVEDLRSRDLLPERRLQEAKAAVERATAELAGKRQRVSALSSERSGALPVRAPADGVIVEVGAPHGHKVEAGAPLVTVASGDGVLLEGRVHDRRRAELGVVASVSVKRGDWQDPRALTDAKVLTERLVFDPHTLSAPLTVVADDPAGLSIGDLVELEVGVGEPQPRLAVPRTAVVEINGQDVVFVQNTGESFTRRRVTLGVTDPTHVEILTGIEPGDMVVVDGGFDVHVASLSGALESHRH